MTLALNMLSWKTGKKFLYDCQTEKHKPNSPTVVYNTS